MLFGWIVLAAIKLLPGPVAGSLGLLGFGPLGPIAGSAAAWYQATFLGGLIGAGSLFSLLQWLAMTI
ncbi:hypothetical protein AJ80_05960 [Polytolypa hystricis UAMH7299]|uniref:Uncharacterized protein n=1 Tax=Polytolypa hystricis (strain UAMH7299) TaxID=1447883 RepID=A0A2B7XZC5_POLH7|nr:hypothetical protein AJ80_05960 [Polytolypa hystricis UAMH7299]